MRVRHLRWLMPCLLLAGTLPAAAQSAPRLAARQLVEVLDAGADVPPVAYRSSLARYRRLADEPLAAWREANETVNRIGGWRTYAREASQPEAATALQAPVPAAVAPPARAGSAPTATGGHKTH